MGRFMAIFHSNSINNHFITLIKNCYIYGWKTIDLTLVHGGRLALPSTQISLLVSELPITDCHQTLKKMVRRIKFAGSSKLQTQFNLQPKLRTENQISFILTAKWQIHMPSHRFDTKRTKSFQLVPKLKLIFMWISLASGSVQVHKVSHGMQTEKIYHMQKTKFHCFIACSVYILNYLSKLNNWHVSVSPKPFSQHINQKKHEDLLGAGNVSSKWEEHLE